MRLLKTLRPFSIISVFVWAMVLSACLNPFSNGGDAGVGPSASESERVQITISVRPEGSGLHTATIYPSLPEGLTYTASFSGPETVSDVVLVDGSATLGLANGTWTLSIVAEDGQQNQVMTGQVEFEVPQVRSVTVPLDFTDTAGNGDVTVNLDVTLPDSVEADILTATLSALGGAGQPLETSVQSPVFPAAVSFTSVPAGEYLFTATIATPDEVELNPIVEVVRVASGTISVGTLVAGAGAFTGLPEAPGALQATPGQDGVELSWLDTSAIARGFFVERSDNGGESYSEVVRLSEPSTTSYIDTEILDFGIYEYRIGFYSATGDSPRSNSATVSVDPPVIYVVSGGTGTGGYSWDDALGDPQAAIDAAAQFHIIPEVWVAAGTYVPQSRPNVDPLDWLGFDQNFDPATDARSVHFSLRAGVELYGGFAGTETSRDERDIATNQTIFSGDINGDDSATGVASTLTLNNYADNAIHVFFHPASRGVDATARLDGVTIRGGYANDVGQDFTHGSGGAMFNYGANPTLANIVVRENRATLGAGIHLRDSDPTALGNVVFERNYADKSGAGLFVTDTPATISNGVFWGNRATSLYGGAISVYGEDASPVQLSNATIVGNHALNDGAAISVTAATLSIVGSVFDRNDTAGGAGDSSLYVTGANASVEIRRSLLTGHPDRTLNPDGAPIVESELLSGTADFVAWNDPDGSDGTWFSSDDGLYPAEGSVLVDSLGSANLPFDLADLDGDGDLNETLPFDITGSGRDAQNGPDLGAYESAFVDSQGPAPVEDLSVSSGLGTLNVSWSAPSDVSVFEYEIAWSPADGVEQPIVLGTDTTSATIDSLGFGESYEVSVYSIDAAGNRSVANVAASSTSGYQVVYEGNDQDGGTAPVDEAQYGPGQQALVLGNSNGLSRAGFEFAGWNTAANGSGTSYEPGDSLSLSSSNVTLYAVWVQPQPEEVQFSSYTVTAAISQRNTPADAASSDIDSAGNTHVAWIRRASDAMFDTVMYTFFDGSSHTNYVVDGSGSNDVSAGVSISVDDNDSPHIVWISKRDADGSTLASGNYAIYWATDDNGDGSFDIRQVSANSSDPTDDTNSLYNAWVNGRPKISFDNGDPVVTYTAGANTLTDWDRYIVSARWNGSSWVRRQEFVPSATTSIDEGFSFPRDFSAGKYAAWVDISEYNPRYYYYNGSSWDDVIISGYADIFDVQHAQIATDNNNNVYVLWSNQADGAFYRTLLDGTSYGPIVATPVDGSIAGNFGPATVDPTNGRAYFVYDVPFSSSLRLVTDTFSTEPTETEIPDAGSVPGLKTFHVHNGAFSLLSFTEEDEFVITTGSVDGRDNG